MEVRKGKGEVKHSKFTVYVNKNIMLKEILKMEAPQVFSKLNEIYQWVSYHPSALKDEEPPLQQQASDGSYRLNCKLEKKKLVHQLQ